MSSKAGSWLAHNKLAAFLAVLSLCLAIAVIVLAVELDKSLSEEDTSDDGSNVTTTTPPADLEPWQQDLRIPEDLVPESYNVRLHPDFSKSTFFGSVVVDFSLIAALDWIPIHIKDLEVTSVVLSDGAGKNVTLRSTTIYEPNEFFVMFPTSSFSPGKYTLKLEFTGSLANKTTGFYKSIYSDSRGERVIATSKFEPVDARAAFPCFDEPALKANFTISLVQPKNDYISLSNMDEDSRTDGPGANEMTVNFKTSVPMSTYLVCFIVCDFKSSAIVNVDNNKTMLPVRVLATPEQVPNTALALSVASQVTKFYLDYFKIPYPLPKLDLIAIPDFVSGAMEHWGLITFRETALLFDPAKNGASAEKRVAAVVAHEIAHQWFGNLVTMNWWDDLWLNEGFASFMESKAVALGVKESQDWALLDQVIYSDIQPVLKTDAALNSHPIVQSVANPDQINQLFDSVSYDKGQAVLRMLEDFMGADKFEQGLNSYLTAHSFGSAKTEDLWASLNASLGGAVNVPEVMATWTRQMGFPVVQVQREASQITLSQERYLADKDLTFDPSESPYGYKWDIPIRFVTSENTSPQLVWLKRGTSKLTLPINNAVTYVKFNSKQVGYYRVNYPTMEWQVLIKNFNKFEPLDKAHLINDVFSLAGSGHTEYNNALDMLLSLATETNYLPWASASTELDDLKTLLASTSTYPTYRKFVGNLVNGLYGTGQGQFSWTVPDNDTHLNRLLRVTILRLACGAGHAKCLEDVGVLFKQWVDNPSISLSADLRPLVYVYGMVAAGTETEWDKVWNIYLKESNVQERVNLLQALANAQEPWLISRFLEYAWDENNVRSQDYFIVLGYIAQSDVGSLVLWDYYRSHWPAFVQRFGLQHRTLGSAILSITTKFCSQLRLQELQAFYSEYPEAGAGSASRKNAEEKIATRIKWLARNTDSVSLWLSTHASL